jgi:hypothetical protein
MKTKHKHRQRDAYSWGSDPIVEDQGEVRIPLMVCDNRPGWVRPLTDAQVAERLAVRDGAGFIGANKPDLSLHQPGFRVADQASRDKVSAARREWLDAQREAWRGSTAACAAVDARRKPDPDDDPDDPDGPDERERDRRSKSSDAGDPRAQAAAEYYRWVARLQDSWRTPVSCLPVNNSRDADPGNSELMRRHLRTEEEDDPQARRDEAYRNYCASISRAWMNPSGGIAPQRALVGPGPTSHIERAGEIERLGEQTRGGR